MILESQLAKIRKLRKALLDIMPEGHFGALSHDAPCNETCRTKGKRPLALIDSGYGEDTCHRHRPDIQGRKHFLADKCETAPDLGHPSGECHRCIALEALKR